MAWEFPTNSLILYVKIVSEIFGLLLIGGLSVAMSLQKALASQFLRQQMSRNIRLQQEHVDILNELPIAIFLYTTELRPQNNIARELLPMIQELRLLEQKREWIHIESETDQRKFIVHKIDLTEGRTLVLMEDVTQIKKLEELMEQEERLAMVGRLTSSLAHEIRNPLASLSGAVQLLSENKENRLYAIILREINRINELVDIYLHTARPKQLKQKWCSLRPMIFEVIQAFEHDPRSRQIEIKPIDIHDISVYVDISKIRQIIWNLLINAVQAISDDGSIYIRDRVEEEYYVLSIRDTGRGISPSIIQKIFDPFFTAKSGGTGLGLAVVEQIISAHKGKITVDSEEGFGTEFCLYFPVRIQ